MMNFILMTLSVMLGLMLAIGLSTMIMLHPKVMKWYMNYVVKNVYNFEHLLDEDQDKEL
jgi:ABC-type arginine/histidine transport system permease subunit